MLNDLISLRGKVRSKKLTNVALVGVMLGLNACTSQASLTQWGMYTYGHEVSVFAPCNSTHELWAEGGGDDVRHLEKASLDKAERVGEPYQAVLAKLRHTLPEKAHDGFAEQYDGAVDILAVEAIEPNGVCPKP